MLTDTDAIIINYFISLVLFIILFAVVVDGSMSWFLYGNLWFSVLSFIRLPPLSYEPPDIQPHTIKVNTSGYLYIPKKSCFVGE